MKYKTFIVILAILCIAIPSMYIVYVAATSYLSALVHAHGVLYVGAVTSMSVPVSFDFGTIDPRVTTTISKSLTVTNTGNIAFNITVIAPIIGTMTPAWLRTYALTPVAIIPILVPAQSSSQVTLTLSFASGTIYQYMGANRLIGTSIDVDIDFAIVTDGIVQ
jgi:hypothetical protein